MRWGERGKHTSTTFESRDIGEIGGRRHGKGGGGAVGEV